MTQTLNVLKRPGFCSVIFCCFLILSQMFVFMFKPDKYTSYFCLVACLYIRENQRTRLIFSSCHCCVSYVPSDFQFNNKSHETFKTTGTLDCGVGVFSQHKEKDNLLISKSISSSCALFLYEEATGPLHPEDSSVQDVSFRSAVSRLPADVHHQPRTL